MNTPRHQNALSNGAKSTQSDRSSAGSDGSDACSPNGAGGEGQEGTELRCACGSLLARYVDGKVELKCRRCKRTMWITVSAEANNM